MQVLQQLFSPSVLHTLDLIGIFVFAISGALLAVRKNFDVFGIAVLSEITALGGGLFRDLIIGAVPPAAFTDLGYFVTPLLATVLVFFLHPHVERIQSAVTAFVLRLLAMRYHWRAPRAWHRRSTVTEGE